jgi:exodeoxyribonuclease VII large subunit
LFDPARKQLLPFLPEIIGVITSPTGAVIRDVLHRLADRFPRPVLVWPVRVQGEGSAAEIAAAIDGFNAPDLPFRRPDVLIVARGGGSLEDLWSFNEEIVLRAAARSHIPLVSAVGHETDWTLLDLVADLRAPTPTAAAEMVVPVRFELAATLRDRADRLVLGTRRGQERRARALASAIRALPSGERVLEGPRQRLDLANLRHVGAIKTLFDRNRLRLSALARKLGAQTPQARLARASEKLKGLGQTLPRAMLRAMAGRGERVGQMHQRLVRAFSTRLVLEKRDRAKQAGDLAALIVRFNRILPDLLAQRRSKLRMLAQLLHSLSYKQVLARGFALVRDGEGRPVRSVAGANAADSLSLEFADGEFVLKSPSKESGAKPKKGFEGAGKPDQGRLF